MAYRGARAERALCILSTAIQLGDLSGKVLRTRRLESRGALALSSTAESVWPSVTIFHGNVSHLLFDALSDSVAHFCRPLKVILGMLSC